MAYYMAQTKSTKDGYQAICEIHGVIGTCEDRDDALDTAAAHDAEHGYDGEDGFEG